MTDNLDKYFSADGPLARYLRGFVHRPEQLEMARMVFAAMTEGRHLAVEAGAGTGKTLAYLVPALLSGLRVIIATGTRTLQDQLYHRDLPAVGRAIGRSVTVAQLKGRANYLCRYRLRTALSSPERWPSARHAELRRLSAWQMQTRSGDIGEVSGVPEDSDIWTAVTSTTENCLGARCPDLSECHVAIARQAAAESDIAIVNHHLLVADLTLREEGFGNLLPGGDVVIVDEAHRFPEVAQTLFDVTLSSRHIGELARDVSAEALRAGGLTGQAQAALATLSEELQQLAALVPAGNDPIELAQAGVAATARLTALAGALEALRGVLSENRDASPGLGHCHDRASSLAATAARLARWEDESDLGWLQGNGQEFAVHLTPLDASRQLRELLERQGCTWIFTSATLAVGDDFTHFVNRIGLKPMQTHRIGSPYDFARCTRLYLPGGLPDPDAPEYTERVVAALVPVLAASRGRAFLLFTSRRSLRRAAEILADKTPELCLLVQGTAPRSRLLEQFARAERPVLLGTGTFWEGVDIRGPGLVVVAIDRLPFASPGDPFLQARLELIRRSGGDPFRSYQLPQAVLSLRQGVGRLIRGDKDYGVVVICDPRLRGRSYGQLFLATLPPMPVTDDLDEVRSFLEAQEAIVA